MFGLVQVSAIGLCSSLGNYQDASGAFRAGLTRFQEHDELVDGGVFGDEPTALTVSPVPDYLAAFQGKGRIIKMLSQAYFDLEKNFGGKLPTENLNIYFAMPDPLDRCFTYEKEELPREQRLQQFIDEITAPLFKLTNKAFHKLPVQCVFGDRVAFGRVLQKAVSQLSEKKGNSLVVVVDSLLQHENLEGLMVANQLKTDDNPVGYIPGEGAIMILLSSEQGRPDNSARPLCQVSAMLDASTIDEEDEEAAREQWQGGKLFELVRNLLGESYDASCLLQPVVDINGGEARATEQALLELKLKQTYPNMQLSEAMIPALGFGETGTIMGALAFMLIVAGIQRGYAQQRQYLILLSEENGKRAVINVTF